MSQENPRTSTEKIPLIGPAIAWIRRSIKWRAKKGLLGVEDEGTKASLELLRRERRRFGVQVGGVAAGVSVISLGIAALRAMNDQIREEEDEPKIREEVDPELAARASLRQNLKKLLGDVADADMLIDQMLEDPANEKLLAYDLGVRKTAFKSDKKDGRFFKYYAKAATPKLKGLPASAAEKLPEGDFFVEDAYKSPDSPKVEWLRSHGLDFYDQGSRTFYVLLNEGRTLEITPLLEARNSDPRPRSLNDPAEIEKLRIETLDDNQRRELNKEFLEAAAAGKEMPMYRMINMMESFAKTYMLSDIIHKFDERKPWVHVNAALSTAYGFLKLKIVADDVGRKAGAAVAGEQDKKMLNEMMAYTVCHRLSLDLSPEMDRFRPMLKEALNEPQKYFGNDRVFTIPTE